MDGTVHPEVLRRLRIVGGVDLMRKRTRSRRELGVSRTTYNERKKRLEGGVTVLVPLRKPAAHRFTSAGPPSRDVKLKQLLLRVPLSNGTTADLCEPHFFEHRRVNPFHWQQYAVER